jgi:hypothetical protein
MNDLEHAPTSFARFMLSQHRTTGSQGCMFQDPTLVLKDIAFVSEEEMEGIRTEELFLV